MTTYGDYFAGFGGMTIGAKAAGLDVLFGVEHDAQLASVYRKNLGDHVTVADVTQLDPASLPAVDVFHASPPCTNASVANANAGESPFDLAMARATVDYLETHKPRIFTLENVYQYRNFESWHYIARALLDLGYAYNFWHVNMADYGVPQTRKRMIAIARRDGVLPQLPEKTHGKQARRGLFGNLARWVSWYDAIEDLIPDLPDSELAPFQTVLPLPDICLVDGNNARPDTGQTTFVSAEKPAFTMAANNRGAHRLKLLSGAVREVSPHCRARFQSFPDWYELPDSASLAAKGIGNAVPPLFAEKLFKEVTT